MCGEMTQNGVRSLRRGAVGRNFNRNTGGKRDEIRDIGWARRHRDVRECAVVDDLSDAEPIRSNHTMRQSCAERCQLGGALRPTVEPSGANLTRWTTPDGIDVPSSGR